MSDHSKSSHIEATPTSKSRAKEPSSNPQSSSASRSISDVSTASSMKSKAPKATASRQETGNAPKATASRQEVKATASNTGKQVKATASTHVVKPTGSTQDTLPSKKESDTVPVKSEKSNETFANTTHEYIEYDIFQIDEVCSVDVKPQVIAVGVAPYQGKPPGPYVPTSEWRIWLKRLENFMKLRNVLDDSKKYVFLDEIGDVNYGILEGLLPGKELEEYTYEQLKDAMTARFQPKTLVMSERFKLTQLTQKSTQNLAEFLAELQGAARSCEFDKITDIRDAFIALAFISGVRSDDTRKKLIEQTGKDSSQLLALAEAHERAGRGARELYRTGLDTVQAVRGRMGVHPHHRTRNSSTGHNHREHTRGKTQRRLFCHICKYDGHSTDDCRYTGLNDESANVVSEDEASLYEYDIDHIEVHAVDLIPEKAPPKCLIETLIDTTPIEFELDTGSGMSVIGYQTWEALGRPNLQETHRAAKAYGGQLLRFRGVLQTEVTWGSKKIPTRLFVLNTVSPSIWGRESIQRFDIDLGPVYRNGIQRAEEVKGVLSGTDHPTPNRA